MDLCGYPGCTLQAFHDSDHEIGRPSEPRGELRLVNEFALHPGPRCDLHFARAGKAFYADSFGYGWVLCSSCIQEHSGIIRASELSRPMPRNVVSIRRERTSA